MKKVILVSAVALLALASCKKNYVCKYDLLGQEFVIDYPDLDKDAKDVAKTSCEALGGNFTVAL